MIRVLIACPEEIPRDALRVLIAAERGFVVVGAVAGPGETPAGASRVSPDVVLLDLEFDRTSGLEPLRAVVAAVPAARPLLLTSTITNAQTVAALRLGARGVILKHSTTAELMKSIRAVMDGEYWIGRDRIGDLVAALVDLERRPEPPFGLTARDLAVLALVAEGLTNRQVANGLGISQDAVKHQIRGLFSKLGVSGRLALVMFAHQHGLAWPVPRSARPVPIDASAAALRT